MNTLTTKTGGDIQALDTPATPMSIIATAVSQGVPVETLRELFALQRDMQTHAARQSFAAAMAEFKATCPPVERRSNNGQFMVVNRDGVKVPRRYASLDDIERTIRGPLGACGLSYRWSEMKVADGMMSLTCVVSHRDGHSEASTVSVPAGSSAGCSEIQKSGAAQTYAMRYSIVQALGLTSCDDDTDGNDEPDNSPPLTEAQVADIEILLSETKSNRAAFLAWVEAATVADIPQSRFAGCVDALKKKKGAK